MAFGVDDVEAPEGTEKKNPQKNQHKSRASQHSLKMTKTWDNKRSIELAGAMAPFAEHGTRSTEEHRTGVKSSK